MNALKAIDIIEGRKPLYGEAAKYIITIYCPNCGARMDGDADANGNDNKTPET